MSKTNNVIASVKVKEGIHPRSAGKQLEDGKTLSDCSIQEVKFCVARHLDEVQWSELCGQEMVWNAILMREGA